jgi:hypothetical protein
MSIGSLLYKPRLCPMTDGPVFPIIARCQKLISSVNLFPLSVYISDVAQHPSLKDGLVPRIKALQPYQPESRYAWTGDVNGHGFIHLDEDFKAWLGAMVPHIQRYLELLQLRTEYPDIYFQRSWPAVAKRHEEIAPNSHEYAHINLVYYLKKPENARGCGC